MADSTQLRAVASLSGEEARHLLRVGLRTLPTTHVLRKLACWARLTWRPSVRVHGMRDLVRSPAALANLSPRSQDMLFAVFRNINASNRDVCCEFFGVLFLAEDPWLIDTGGDGENNDALRAIEAFHRLYDARHQYLGNLASSNADLIYRESDALRRQLGQNAPIRVPVTESMFRVESQPTPIPTPPAHAPVLQQQQQQQQSPRNAPTCTSTPSSTAASASAMEGVEHLQNTEHPSVSTTHHDTNTLLAQNQALEDKVETLENEVETLKAALKDNELRTKHLQTLFDFMAKVLLDELQISVAMPSSIVTTNRRNGPEGSVSLSPELRSNRQASTTCTTTTTTTTATSISADGTTQTEAASSEIGRRLEHRLRLLERFREVVEAAPWEPYSGLNGNGSRSGSQSGAAVRSGSATEGGGGVSTDDGGGNGGTNGARSGCNIFRDGKWIQS